MKREIDKLNRRLTLLIISSLLGTNCEYDYIECSGNETGKYCFHGSQCLSDGRCECLIDVPGQGKVLSKSNFASDGLANSRFPHPISVNHPKYLIFP